MSKSLEAMSRLTLFQGLTMQELGVLSHHLRIQKLGPLEEIFAEGDPPRSCYVVLGGAVEVIRLLSDGAEERLAMLEPGALLGHMALVDNKPRSATCRASVGGAKLLELGRLEFDRLFSAKSTFAFKILDRVALDLASRLRDANERLIDARRAESAPRRRQAARAAAERLHGFDIPESVHGVDLSAITVEASIQDRRVKERR